MVSNHMQQTRPSVNIIMFNNFHDVIVNNPFSTNVPLLYPLKTSENLWFFRVFRGCRSGTLIGNRLIIIV